jgi:hypothetical protein
MPFERSFGRENLRGLKAYESRRSHPDLTHREAITGYGFFKGRKPLKSQGKAERFYP